MLAVPSGDDGVAAIKLPFLDLSKASANIFGKRAVDAHTGHAVGWVSETFEMGLGFAFSLEGSGIAGLHVDADYVPRVVVHRVPETAVAMFHALARRPSGCPPEG